jgi:hypothetical protein
MEKVRFEEQYYGQILKTKNRITSKKLSGYLIKKLEQKFNKSKKRLNQDVVDLAEKFNILVKIIRQKLAKCPKSLVHHDYYLNNVLMTPDFKLSAVLDFSEHTIIGDWKMDVAGAVTFLGINSEAKKYIPYMRKLAASKYGSGITKILDLCLIYYSIYYSNIYRYDMVSYNWAVENLNNEKLWERIKK